MKGYESQYEKVTYGMIPTMLHFEKGHWKKVNCQISGGWRGMNKSKELKYKELKYKEFLGQ